MSQSPRRDLPWTADQIPDQTDRTAVITGANTGVGFEVAKVLADRGATVVLACRDLAKANAAAARITATTPHARVEVQELDLASLASVRRAAESLGAAHPHVDLLINNAGLMWAPYGQTEDGFERHFGVNHLGHFALTGLILPSLTATPDSRIVTLSSPAHRNGTIGFDDLQSQRGYKAMKAYSQSKLANLLFVYALHRRLEAARALVPAPAATPSRSPSAPSPHAPSVPSTIALAAHPGGARSELNRTMPILFRGKSWGLARPITHSTARGALPILRAATDPAARGGQYYAPNGRFEFKGDPTIIESTPLSHDAELQQRLWEISTELTTVQFPLVR